MLSGESKSLKTFKGDGGYDKFGFRKTLGNEVIQVIQPPKNAVLPIHRKVEKGHM